MAHEVGMIGLGLMGTAMARNLLAAGSPVTGYDVVLEKVQALVGAGGRGAKSAADVARQVEIVITSLPDGSAVEQALLGSDGVAEGGRPGLIVIETSTVAPGTARTVASRLAERGLSMLDATVSGISHMVARKDCIFMVGGDRTVFERCQPIWEALGRRAYYVGPRGAGAQMKLVTNLIMGVNSLVTAEGLALGMKAGLDSRLMLEILRDSAAASRMLGERGQFMVDRTYEPPVARIDLFLKDIALMLENGRQLDVPLPLTETMQRMFQAAKGDGHGPQELAAVIETYRRLAGIGEEEIP